MITVTREVKSTGDYLRAKIVQSTKPDARKRNPGATKDTLLDAARTEFQRMGYDAASTRNIASEAGCNAALINRYFGSKLGLLEAVMEECIDLTPLDGLPPNEMVAALADIALGKVNPTGNFDPMVVAIKSSGSEEAQDVIRSKLGNPMVEQLASLIGGDKADQKAGILLSIVSGMFVGRVSVDADAVSTDHNEALRELLYDAMMAVVSSGT